MFELLKNYCCPRPTFLFLSDWHVCYTQDFVLQIWRENLSCNEVDTCSPIFLDFHHLQKSVSQEGQRQRKRERQRQTIYKPVFLRRKASKEGEGRRSELEDIEFSCFHHLSLDICQIYKKLAKKKYLSVDICQIY